MILYYTTDDVTVDVTSPDNSLFIRALEEMKSWSSKLTKNKIKFDHSLSEINDAYVICSLKFFLSHTIFVKPLSEISLLDTWL